MKAPTTLRIPRGFYLDHVDRFGDAAPAAIKAQGGSFWIAADDPQLPALIADAEFYAEGNSDAPHIQRAATALLKALHRQQQQLARDAAAVAMFTQPPAKRQPRARRRGRPRLADPRIAVALRIQPQLLARLKRQAASQRIGYQTLMQQLLERHTEGGPDAR